MPRSINTDSGWTIPDDWDGESWACVELQWPDSDQWRGLLRDLMYSLTRGRSWSKDTGTITAVQPVGWEVFNRNWPLIECGEPILDEEDNCVAFLPRDDRIITSIEPNNPFSGTGDVPDLWNSPPMLRGNQVTDLIGVTGVQDSDLICWPLDLEGDALDFILSILTLEWEIPRFKVEWDGPATVELHLLQIPNGGYAVIVPDSPLDTDFVLLQSTTLGSFFDDILGLIDSLIEGSLYSEYIYEYQTDDPGPHKLDVYFIPYIVPSLNPLDLFDMGWGGGLREVVICQDDISIPPCDDCPDCPDCPDGPGLPDDGQWPDYISAGIGGGGIGGGCCSDESEDCMANLGPCPPIRIQDGVLQFFWCCQWVDIGEVGDTGLPDDPPDDPPDGDDQVYSACGKAHAVVGLLYDVGVSAWDERDNLPWQWTGHIESDSGYDLNDAEVYTLVLRAIRMGLSSDITEEELFNETTKQSLICRVESILGDDYGGFDNADFESLKSFLSIEWKLNVFAENFWIRAAMAIGKDNFDKAAKAGSIQTDLDCECPDTGGGVLSSFAWRGSVTVTREDGTYQLERISNSGLTAEHKFVTETGSYKALEITGYVDATGGETISDILICLEPVTPADELLHKTWLTSGCGVVDSNSMHGELLPTDQTAETVTVSDGKVWINGTYSVPKTMIYWNSKEARSCPQNQTEQKTYQFKAHIARVNGTATGVVTIPAGV